MRDRESIREQGTVEIPERVLRASVALWLLALIAALAGGYMIGGGRVSPSEAADPSVIEVPDQTVARLLKERRQERLLLNETGLPEVIERLQPGQRALPEPGTPVPVDEADGQDGGADAPRPPDAVAEPETQSQESHQADSVVPSNLPVVHLDPDQLDTEQNGTGAIQIEVDGADPTPADVGDESVADATPAAGGPCGPIDFNPTSGQGKWTVQVASYQDEQTAKGMVDHLRANCFRAYRTMGIVNGTTWYRVRVGQFVAREDAELRIIRLGDFTEFEPIVETIE